MPIRSVSLSDKVYIDLHSEMALKNMTFSQVVERRLNKLLEIENGEKHV